MLAGSLAFAGCGSDRDRRIDADPDVTPDTPDVDAGFDVGDDGVIGPDTGDVEPDPDVWDADPDADADVDVDAMPDAPAPYCGDGLRDPDEACDDGNDAAGDGCSDACELEFCGDGAVSPGLGEECEDGVAVDATCRDLALGDGDLGCIEDACRFDVRGCERGRCGDGEVTGDEGCDDGNVLDGDGCSSLCFPEACLTTNPDCETSTEVCDGADNDGDGLVDDHPTDPGLGEPCDAGCGDGVLTCLGGEVVCVGPAPVDPPVCNGRDDECVGEVDRCDAAVDAGTSLVREVAVASPPVDVLLLVDGSPSMAESRAYLARRLADGWWPATATHVAVATVGDVPVAPFGAPTDRPWVLHRRASNRIAHADRLADAFANTAASRAGDPGLAAWPALTHAADGAGFVWPGRPRDPAPMPRTLVEVSAEQTPTYRVDVRAGQRVDIEVVSARVGEPLDAIVEVYAPDNDDVPIARNDDRFATDPAVTVIAPADGALGVRIVPCCGEAPSTAGWAGLDVRVDGQPHVTGPRWGACTAATGDDAGRHELVDARTVWPRPVDECVADCADTGAPASLIRDFCGDGRPLGRCGNGRVDSGETCDDGDFVVGDGCGADCQLESDRVAPFDPLPGYVASQGHGDRGGFGFTEGARPVIAWITDSPAHDTPVWDAIEADLPGAAEAAERLLDAGVVPIVVDPSGDAAARDTFAEWALRAGGTTDVCAWSEARSCPVDRCCDGTDRGIAPVRGVCPLAVGGDGASLSAHVDNGLVAAANAPLTLDLAIESDVDGADCLIDAIALTTDSECGPDIAVDLAAGRVFGIRAGDRLDLTVATSNRDTRDTDGDENLTEACVRGADVPVRIVARNAAGAVFIDESFTIRVE